MKAASQRNHSRNAASITNPIMETYTIYPSISANPDIPLHNSSLTSFVGHGSEIAGSPPGPIAALAKISICVFVMN
jgi:hypothetical protein